MLRRFKVALCVLLFLFYILLMRDFQFKIEASNGYPVHNLDTGFNYTSIQAAIDAPETENGHTIFVDEGTYFEHVTVYKSLTLLGEGRETTIIDGNMTGNVVRITQDYVNIKGFTIQRSGRASFNSGISISSTRYCSISANRIVDNEVGVYGSPSNTSITDNTIGENNVGVAIEPGATSNLISRNHLVANTVSVHLYHADSNHVLQNNMTNNWRSVTLWHSKNNMFYHNNFLNNTEKILVFPYTNFLDNGFEGNYWSNYSGVDLNHDGIGDSPYVIDENNTDHYPLMGMFYSFNTSSRDYVNIISNSTIESFNYSESEEKIILYVFGDEGIGFCRACIPNSLMDIRNISVIIDGGITEVLYFDNTIFDNGTHTWIYFAYQYSTHEIIITPEFPSLILLPLLITVTTMIAFTSRKRGN